VVVDAKPEAVGFHEAYGFLPLDIASGQSGARPMPTSMFLPTREIMAARGRKPR
jgi:hypothetical protein